MFQVVQEYERAVIFRLGRLLHGGSRGPGKTGITYYVRIINVRCHRRVLLSRKLNVLSGFTSVMKTLRTNTLTQPMTTQPVYTIQNWS